MKTQKSATQKRILQLWLARERRARDPKRGFFFEEPIGSDSIAVDARRRGADDIRGKLSLAGEVDGFLGAAIFRALAL
jgi:hypothetical protein